MYSGEDSDDPEHSGSSAGLYIKRSVAHVQNLSDVIDSTCFHRVKNHVGRRSSYLHVIAADVGSERLLPPSGIEDAVSYRSVETGGRGAHDIVRFQPGKRRLSANDGLDSAI